MPTNNSTGLGASPFDVLQSAGVMVGQYAMYVIGTAGVIGNLFVLYCQFRVSRLRNFFVGLLAFSDAVVSCNFLVSYFYNRPRFNVSQLTCSKRFALFVGFLCWSTALACVVGCDRLLAVAVPVKYKSNKQVVNIVGFLVSLSYTISVFSVSLAFASDQSILMCSVPSSLNPLALAMFSQGAITINLLMVLVYSALVFRVKKKGSGNVDKQQRQMTTSIIIVAAVQLSTWALSNVVLFAAPRLPISRRAAAFLSFNVGVLAVTNNAVNPLIYVSRSQDYREFLFKSLLGAEKAKRWTMKSTGAPVSAAASQPRAKGRAVEDSKADIEDLE